MALLTQLAEVKLQVAWQWARQEQLPYSAVLAGRTFLVNLTPWHDGQLFDYAPAHPADEAAWRAFLTSGDQLFNSGCTPKQVLGLLPDLSARVTRDLADLHDPVTGLAARPSCLWANLGDEGSQIPAMPGRFLDFHIANNRYPGSFLQQPSTLDDALARLAAEARDAGFQGLRTTSWLNAHPAWLAHFPPVWRERRRGGHEVGPHLGCWGQLLTARQTLAAGPAENLLRTGRFRYEMLTSYATLEELGI